MDTEQQQDIDSSSESTLSPRMRIAAALTGVVIPVVLFWVYCLGSGQRSDPLLHSPAFMLFALVAHFNALGLMRVLIRPSSVGDLAVRWTIYAGAFQSAVLLFLGCCFMGPLFLFSTLFAASIAAVILYPLVVSVTWLVNRFPQFSIRDLLIVTLGCGVIVAIGRFGIHWQLLEACLTILAFATPALYLATWLRVSYWACYQSENSEVSGRAKLTAILAGEALVALTLLLILSLLQPR